MDLKLSSPSDQDLVAATLRDRQAFRAIVEKYQEPLRRYVRRLGCTNSDDAEDVLQELFIKCYMNLEGYDPDLKFSSWLYRIAHNETISFFRKKKIRPKVALSEEDLRLFENIPDETYFLDALLQKSDAETLRNALEHIDEKYRTPLMLRFFEEKSYTEISDILQLPGGTVATYINRAKRGLKEILIHKRNI